LRTTDALAQRSGQDVNLPGAVATDYLELTALAIFAWLWGRMADAAAGTPLAESKMHTARFFYARLLPRVLSLEVSIAASSDAVMASDASSFE